MLIVRSLVEDGTSSLADGLAAAVHGAVRLDGRPVPADAPAVLAMDLAQLLAQYVVDLHDGMVAGRWWWRFVGPRLANSVAEAQRALPAGHLPGAAPVAPVLAAFPREAPHVVADLVRRRRGDVVRDVPLAAVLDVLLVVATTYAAEELAAVLRAAMRGYGSPTPDSATQAVNPPVDPASPAELLITVSARFALDPVGARSPSFARFVGVLAGVPTWRAGAAGLVEGVGTGQEARQVAAVVESPASAWVQDDPRVTGESGTAEADSWNTRAVAPPESSDGDTARAGEAGRHDDVHGGNARLGDARQGDREGDRKGDARPDDLRVPELPPPASAWRDGVLTNLGGAFLLIRAFELAALGEPSWVTLDLLARSLVRRDEPSEEDPVWAVLAELATPVDLVPSSAGSLGGPGAARSTGSEGMLAISESLASAVNGAERRWLAQVRPGLVAVLCDALDTVASELENVLLRRPARVSVDRTHVDVVLPLSAASVVVRRAGLDRDPGWVPSLARVVAFHFDDDRYAGGPG
ncbi:hypothetical protein [Humibacillus xanthopallidus]|uniref:hypothetical protein n=1 Tax=Humibacillus xanthopallidus TaxID=412689 RepID=UPI00114ED1BC